MYIVQDVRIIAADVGSQQVQQIVEEVCCVFLAAWLTLLLYCRG